MNILVTAIGSFSADCVISTLKGNGHRVIGCDIYPAEWHAVSSDCDRVYRSPLARDTTDYINFILDVCEKESVSHVIPLTDIEIDQLNLNRDIINKNGVVLCMPSESTLSVARDKYGLYKTFLHDAYVPSVPTYLVGEDTVPLNIFPCIAKPYNGRSSEGLLKIYDRKGIGQIIESSGYIVQPMVEGPVFTVDYVRSAETGHDFSIPREELLRTKNGAGITVRVFESEELSGIVSHIGEILDINGCVNMEFILHDGRYYLIDINPRFSAGVAFSKKVGYDMVTSHLNCHVGGDICGRVRIDDHIICKKYIEEVTA